MPLFFPINNPRPASSLRHTHYHQSAVPHIAVMPAGYCFQNGDQYRRHSLHKFPAPVGYPSRWQASRRPAPQVAREAESFIQRGENQCRRLVGYSAERPGINQPRAMYSSRDKSFNGSSVKPSEKTLVLSDQNQMLGNTVSYRSKGMAQCQQILMWLRIAHSKEIREREKGRDTARIKPFRGNAERCHS